jgi:hypothetical protein
MIDMLDSMLNSVRSAIFMGLLFVGVALGALFLLRLLRWHSKRTGDTRNTSLQDIMRAQDAEVARNVGRAQRPRS